MGITNEQIIEKLTMLGYINQSDIATKADNLSTVHEAHSWRYGNHYTNYSYMIPIDIYKENISKRFKTVIPIGTMVRVRPNSTRTVKRSRTQDVGDTYSWQHIGLGTGKEYLNEVLEDIKGQGYWTWWVRGLNLKTTIGNNRYPANLISATAKAKSLNDRGVQSKDGYYYGSKWQAKEFLKEITISGDGMFGPKQVINGYINNIFVHFLYPTWETKRESRYEVLFETGARAIFTSDYLEQVYDTDFQNDDCLMSSCQLANICSWKLVCTHSQIHRATAGCREICSGHNLSKTVLCETGACRTIFDYNNLFDTTHGRALDDIGNS